MLDANVETLSNIIKKRIFLDLHTDKYAGASVEELAIVGELFKLWNEVKEQLNNSKNDDNCIWKKAPLTADLETALNEPIEFTKTCNTTI